MSKTITITLPDDLASKVRTRADAAGVKESTWCYHAVMAAALGVALRPQPRPSGLAAADEETRAAVARSGVEGRIGSTRKRRRKSKGGDRG